jgi:hypothetical protein
MRQYFTPQERVDHVTLLPHEHGLLANKSGINRRGFVVLLKSFQWEGRFPEPWQEVPNVLVQHMAATLNLPADGIRQDEREGRTARYQKEQIRQWRGFRPGTTTDANTMTAWVCAHTRVDDATLPHLIARLTAR